MLKQLARLSVEADGRYATASELQFLKDYLKTADLRVSAYKKVQGAVGKIIDQVEAKSKSIAPNAFSTKVFHSDEKNCTDMFRRDTTMILELSAAAMLIDDLDRLREGFLVWHRTILYAINVEYCTQVMCQVLPDVVKEYLTPEEADLMMPALGTSKAVLG